MLAALRSWLCAHGRRLLSARFHTTIFNWWLVAAGRASWWRRWFSCGVLCCLCLLLPAVCLIVHTCWWQLGQLLWTPPAQQAADASWTLQPLIPGVNRPLSDVPVYVVAVLVCTVLHELGHALAAVRERVRVFGCGVLVTFCVAAAYVELDSEALSAGHPGAVSPAAQLRIMCAGVWHNVVLTAVSLTLVVVCSPATFTAASRGVSVLSVSSDIYGESGFSVGDTVTAVDSCRVDSVFSWRYCVQKRVQADINDSQFSEIPPTGFCVSRDFINVHNITEHFVKPQADTLDSAPDTDSVPCCTDSVRVSHMCFSSVSDHSAGVFSCLPARAVVDNGLQMRCHEQSDCRNNDRFDHTNRICVQPAFTDAHTRLLLVHRISSYNSGPHNTSVAVIFVGRPQHLLQSLAVTEHMTVVAWLVQWLRQTFGIIASVSATLALVNLVPAHGLDGHWIMNSLLMLMAAARGDTPSKWWLIQQCHVPRLTAIVSTIGTCLLVVCVVLAVTIALFIQS